MAEGRWGRGDLKNTNSHAPRTPPSLSVRKSSAGGPTNRSIYQLCPTLGPVFRPLTGRYMPRIRSSTRDGRPTSRVGLGRISCSAPAGGLDRSLRERLSSVPSDCPDDRPAMGKAGRDKRPNEVGRYGYVCPCPDSCGKIART